VDLGTTTVCWQATDAAGEILAEGSLPNPQSGAGGDVVSRLAVAATDSGRSLLGRLVRDMLAQLLARLRARGGTVTEICLAANTAMTAIFMDAPVDGLLGAPYRRPLAGNVCAHLPGLAPVWLPPQPAPFVGGDLAAGMAWAMYGLQADFPFLFADMGTNGECALAPAPGFAWLTSVPLGPALEGVGLSCGGPAGPGAVTRFSLGPQGLVPTVIGGGAPRHLCGTGAISLLDCLRRLDVLGADGRPGTASLPLAGRLLRSFERRPDGWRLPLPGGLYLSAADVEAVLKVRAAFAVALDSLLRAAAVAPGAIRRVFLAGSMGEHAPVDALARLGFFPRGLRAGVESAGNSALAGAALLLAKPELRPQIRKWSDACRLVDCTCAPDFLERFANAMRL
jgi:uncharacterized 2Fe-2S/4Fe-4S cluster protein (DUF4445 family)